MSASGPDSGPGELWEVPTERGPARVRTRAGGPRGLLCLGHGAGGGVDAPDLAAAAAAAVAAGWTVALVEQPYRVAGRRAPEPAARLDIAWLAVVSAVRRRHPSGPLVVGGRSSGARVACRTAHASRADAVLCLAFPLHPPGRGRAPRPSRLPELLAVEAPCLVVQGERDPFGSAADLAGDVGPLVTVVSLPGDHSLRQSAGDVARVVAGWLDQLVA